MKSRILAHRYAKAVIGNAAEGNYQSLLHECEQIRELFLKSDTLSRKLKSKFIKQQKKQEVFDLIVENTEHHQLWQGFFKTVLQKQRETLVVRILDEIERILYIKLDMIKMHLLFAREQKPATVDKIKKYYEKELGKKIVIEQKYDESIIGGFVAIIGNTRIDGSVKHTLELFKKSQVV